MSKDYWGQVWSEVKQGWKDAAWSYSLMVILTPICFILTWIKMLLGHEISPKDMPEFVFFGIMYTFALVNGWFLHRSFLRWKNGK